MISDIVLTKSIPKVVKNSIEAHAGCISSALMKKEYIKAIKEAGFRDIKIIDETSFPAECFASDPPVKALTRYWAISPEITRRVISSVLSLKVYGRKGCLFKN